MRNYLLLLVMCFYASMLSAQEFKADIGYQYFYAHQWDKAIQTYNFSRPSISNKQPLLLHGINASVAYIFKSPKSIKHGIQLAYTYTSSKATNTQSINLLSLHFIRLGYLMHYDNPEKIKGLYFDINISANSSALFRNINQSAFIYDDTPAKAFSIGAEAGLKLGYYIPLKKNCYFSPFVSTAYTPYMYSPQTETVINQTKSLSSKNWTSIVNAQIGIAFHFRKA